MNNCRRVFQKRYFKASIFFFAFLILTLAASSSFLTSYSTAAPFQAQLPRISIVEDIARQEGNSGATIFNYTVRLSSAPTQPVSVNFFTIDGTAQAGSDYMSVSTRLAFNPGGPTSLNVPVTVNGDATPELDEFFSVDLSNPTNAVLDLPSRKRGGIINDDAAGGSTPNLSIGDVRMNEGTGGPTQFRFNVALSSPSARPVSVNFAAKDGNARAGEDYQQTSGVLNFPAGSTSQSIIVNVIGDSMSESDEVFFVELSNPINAAIPSGGGRGTGVILNDDGDTQPTLGINDVKMVEGNSGTNRAIFTIIMSRMLAQPVTVDFATADGSATAGSDYVAASGRINFAPGTVIQTIAVTVNGDTAIEPDESFTLNLKNAVNATIAKAQGTGVIINDDGGGDNQPTLMINELKGPEGDAGTRTAMFNVTLSRAAQQTVTVDFSTVDGNAMAGSDYVQSRGTLTFAPGSTMQTIKIDVNGDVMVEPDEVFFVVLLNPTNAVIGNGRGAGLILNDDGGGLPRLSIDDVRVTEGDAGTVTAMFTVSLSSVSKQTASVNFATTDGNARDGIDYRGDRGMLTFQPGATTQTISITIIGDAMPEPDEAFFVVLNNSVNAAIGKDRAVGVIITDDGGTQQPTLEFSDPNYRVDEGAVKAVITVVRSGSSAGRVSASFTTRNGTALANSDYAPLFGTVVFNDGDMNPKTFIVPILDDNTVERDEFLVLVLMNPMGGARIGRQDMALLNINDGDTSNNPILRTDRTVDFGAVASSDTAVRAVNIMNAGGGSLNFTLTLATGADAGFSIDSQSTSGTLGSGETASFNISFKPLRIGLSTGILAVTSNGGNMIVRLLASSDATPPSVTLTSPSGGETVTAGQPFTIRFSGSDDELTGFLISLSTDGGATFTSEIARVGPDASSVIWNVPDSLDTTQAVIKAAARDRSGNIASDISGTFAVQKSQSNAAMLQVVLSFDPPGDDQLIPPQNLVVTVSDSSSNSTLGAAGLKKKRIKSNVDAAPTDVIGYNIFRAAIPEDGSAIPTSDQIVSDPNNLVGSTTGDSITFMDTASTSNGDNFVYSATSYFGNGQQSDGSNAASTDLPVIKNAKYDKGAIFMDSAGSFIATSGAVLIVDDKESYQLATDSTGSRFTVSKKALSTPSGLKLKKLIKKGSTVTLVVKNPDGKLSLPVMLTRTN